MCGCVCEIYAHGGPLKLHNLDMIGVIRWFKDPKGYAANGEASARASQMKTRIKKPSIKGCLMV